MQKDRLISDSDIIAALGKGTQKAREILEKMPADKLARQGYLQSQFDTVVYVVDHLLENFDIDKYIKRNNHKSPASTMKSMLMAAFEAVRCLEEIEPILDTINNRNVLPNNGLEAHMRLLRAVRVFETNGKNDSYSFVAQRVLSAYKVQDVDPPAGPREKHFA